jgi:MGT family glycosyltransferase
MSRILFVVPPLVGHINPTVSVGAELTARGHQVAWAGLPEVVDPLLPGEAQSLPVTGGWDRATYEEIQDRSRGLRGAAALKFLWQDFLVPLARTTAGDVDRAIDTFDPDLLVIDQQAVGAAAVARRRGLLWATSATTSAELTNPLAELPPVDEWVREQLYQLQVDLGIDPVVAAGGDLRFSDRLVLAFTTRELAGDPTFPSFGGQVRFVGPSLDARPEPVPFDWDWLDPSVPLVLVTLGTVNAEVGGRFFAAAVEALTQMPVQGVIVAPPEAVTVPWGEQIVVTPRVPQLALLRRCSVVVCHGGHNTVCEALAQRIPLVVAPIRDDQPIIAEQVVRAGAGLRVRFARVRAPELGGTVQRALEDQALRDGAARIAESFNCAGGVAAAAEALEACLEKVGTP